MPITSVLGVQATESERDKATPTFYIKPVSMEGYGLKGFDRLEDKGEWYQETVVCPVCEGHNGHMPCRLVRSGLMWQLTHLPQSFVSDIGLVCDGIKTNVKWLKYLDSW